MTYLCQLALKKTQNPRPPRPMASLVAGQRVLSVRSSQAHSSRRVAVRFKEEAAAQPTSPRAAESEQQVLEQGCLSRTSSFSPAPGYPVQPAALASPSSPLTICMIGCCCVALDLAPLPVVAQPLLSPVPLCSAALKLSRCCLCPAPAP